MAVAASSTIRVLLVDDYEVVLEGLQRMLEMDSRIQVVGTAGSGPEAIAKAQVLRPHVVTMDLRMGGMDGIAATRELKQLIPDTRVLAFTMYGHDLVHKAIEAGVSGYLLKDADCADIIDAIHQVHEGHYPMPPSLARGPASDPHHATDRHIHIQRGSVIAAGQHRLPTPIPHGASAKPSTVKT